MRDGVDERVEDYYYRGSTWEMAEALVDSEDAVSVLTEEVKRLEAELAELRSYTRVTAPENREEVVKVLREEARLRSPWFVEFLRREQRIDGGRGFLA